MCVLALLYLVKETTQLIDFMLSQKQIFLLSSILGFLAVVFGAFGAHALKEVLTTNGRTETYELAVRYHFYHTFILLAIGLLMNKYPSSAFKYSALLFLIGIVMFSGSLYAFSLINISLIAAVTPIGGLFLISGWSTLFIAFLRSSN